jgi:RNA polymerase sigma factor (sigma-70 family)
VGDNAVNLPAVEDRAIVQALRDRDRAGLAAAYDRYAQRLFDYCVGLLHDQHTAADAVHDTLLVAADRAQQLRDADRLRPWLYAIARNECLRQLRQRNRLAPLEKAGEVKDETVDLGRSVHAEQAQALVRDAAAGLNPREQEVLNLTLRHELSGAELAAALGVSANHAHALTSKAREQLERSVGALLTARAGRGDCGELDTMLSGWDGTLTPLLRKRVSRHLEKCAVCGVRRAHEVRAEALFAAIPFAVLPIALRRRVLDTSADLNRVAHHGRIAAPYDRSGFPVPLEAAGRRSRAAAWLAGAAVITLLLGGGAAMTLKPGAGKTLAEPPARTTPTTEAPLLSESPVPSPTSASPSPSPSASPTPSPRPSPTRRSEPPPPRPRSPQPPPPPTTTRPPPPSPSPSPSPRPLPRPVVSNPNFDGGCFGATASATVTGPPIARVWVEFWRTKVQTPRRGAPMSPDGNDWFGTVSSNEVFYSEQVTYVITAVAQNGETDSERGTSTIYCVE